MLESLEFYNNFDKKLINDYIYGNKRIESAILKLSPFIPENSRKILDVGCGIGWSSYELSKYCSQAKIEGIDFSPRLIETAQKLFSNVNLNYRVFNILNSGLTGDYDCVIMIDVYEHIPKRDREKFHKSLKELLKDQGRVVLACPSKYHQEWLRNNQPEGLQPIDEDVDLDDVRKIAQDVNGEIIFFEYQKIWMSFDYFYAVIEINPLYDFHDNIIQKSEIFLEKKTKRIVRVNELLNLKFTVSSKKQNKKGLLTRLNKWLRFQVKKRTLI